jgi:SAM-dependent methyltransferase
VSFDDAAAWFDDHYGTTRGRVRLTLLLDRLAETLPPPPARILDVGGGTGVVAVPLAEGGYDVTMLEPSHGMRAIAAERIDGSGARVRLVAGGVEDLDDATPGPFDAICCHAVLLYLDDPAEHLTTLRSVATSGAVLSLLEKNRLALAMRPGIRGDYAEALRVLDDPIASGNLGIPNRSRAVDQWQTLLAAAGWRLDSWVGIRGFSDFAADDLADATFDELLRLEREAGRREPYRSIARLVHLSATAV